MGAAQVSMCVVRILKLMTGSNEGIEDVNIVTVCLCE